MASLVVVPSQNSFYLYFTGLQYPEASYQQFAFQVGNLIVNTTSNGVTIDRYDTSLYIQCGTSYVCAGAAKYNNVWYTIDSGTSYSTLACSPARPTNWSWSFTVAAGQSCQVPASSWLSFQNKINAFRAYKGLSSYSFTTAGISSGNTFYASFANEARAAISAMSPPTSVPSSVSSGSAFTAAWLNQLTNALNSIP